MNMKKINVIYKSLLWLCLLCLTDIAGAQVTGNQYKQFDTNSGINEAIDDITAKYEDGTDASGIYNSNVLDIKNAFDGKSGNWWSSSKNAKVNIDIKFTEAKELVGFNIYRSNANTERESGIEVYTKSAEDGEWELKATFGNYDLRSYNAFFPASVNTQYLRLQLIYTGSTKVSVDEITLYGSIDDNAYGEILHKWAKWFDLRSNLSEAAIDMDTFSDTTKWYKLNGKNIQAAHTYIDTIYAHKGTTVELSLPERHKATATEETSISINSYQRWYSFRTDATFRTNNQGENQVWDLLTPTGKDIPYRFENGYVGRPMTSENVMDMNFYVPTDEQFKAWFPGSTVDNNYYIVACDVSAYTDYTEKFDDNSKNSTFYQSGSSPYEPTLAHRVLFYIVCVDDRTSSGGTGGPAGSWDEGFGRLQNEEYQGGYAEGKKFLEERTINMSAKRVSNNTQELVALTKDARSFAIPDAAPDDDSESVYISLEENTAGISLVSTKLTGVTRTIQFKYPKENSDGTRSVNSDNSHAVICVTKTVNNVTYNLARYNLVFRNEQQLLTETQLAQIADGSIANTELLNYAYRTKNHLDENYELLTELDFDYDPSVAELYGKDGYYPFPLEWGSSSYAFYDGATGNDFKNAKKYPEWGYYAIQNGPVEWDTSTDKGNAHCDPLEGSTYHLYIDASDRPGLIARLPFEDKLCRGSELFVTAMVNSAKGDADDASMLLTIMGVKKGAAVGDQDSYTPLYTYSTGQIPKPSRLSGTIPGTGQGQNDWYQVYFSFINDNDVEYDSYVLQVENNSYSTNGGDMYLDNIQVYISKPTPHVSQKEFSCINERTKMNFYLDWGQLCERLGMDENSTSAGTHAIDFCFVDTVKYTNAIKAGKDQETALRLAIEHIGDGNDPASGGYDATIATIHFYENFNTHQEYNTQGDNLAIDNKDESTGYYFFYRAGSGEDRKLSVDFYATLSPYRPYWMLIRDHAGSVSTLEDFAISIYDLCGIKSDFYVEPTALIKVNGEIVKPETDFCIGQIFNFTAQVRVPTGSDDEGNNTYMLLDDVNFDWFFGTEDDFIAENSDFGDVSLNEALTQFREIEAYRNYESLEGVSAQGAFTQYHIDIINYYLNAEGEAGGLHKRLVLCKPHLDIAMLEGGLQVVMRPIKTTQPSGITEDQWVSICWEYIPLALTSNHNAPVLHAGFNPVNYPTDDFNPNLRIGLAQIRKASDVNNTLRIDLRKAKLVSEGATSLGLITNRTAEENEVYQQIYLTATNDPQYTDLLLQHPGAFSLPIGRLTELFAEEYKGGSTFNDHADVYFYLNEQTLDDGTSFTFNPREGYEYTFSLHFEEHGEDVLNTCEGTFPLTMKVVPEYMEWVGQTQDGKYANWNNDDNWKRIESTTINKNVTGSEDYFTNGGTNETTNGFVPMLFTKVIMPENSQVELYAAGYKGYNGITGVEWDTSRPIYIADPTENIQYDLMAFESGSPLKTERYRVSLLNQIHFEPGAEMLHAEYLLYDTAWVDYQLDKGRWYTLASPLKAVVAGDFYTDSSKGTEESEYFKDITFNTTDNNRFSPSVYQRAWKGSTAMMVIGNNQNNEERAIAGNWSALYNDVAEAYTPGTGFSLKVQDIADNKTSATFRLPKADGSYDYYSYDGQTSVNTSVSREEDGKDVSGRLRSDTLYIRNTDLTDAQQGAPIEITLPETAHGGYYLVGNPFMAHLNMDAFFKGQTFNTTTINNGDVLECKYWYLDDNGTQVAVTYDEENNVWTSTKTDDDFLIPPLRSFFVVKKEEDNVIKFTPNMQVLGGTGDGLRSANALTITATTSDGRTSRAAVAYDMAASADYEASEDAELFLDSNLGDVPMVYTVAGTMATSINRTSELYNIPLGVYGNKQEMVTLSFGGLNQFSSATLYDAQEQTETPLREGKTVSVPAGTSGRYFLRAGTPTGNEVIARNAFLVYSVGGGKVMVTSSNTPLKDIRVYTMGGAQIRSIQASGMQQEIYLNRGIYLITVSDQDGLQETKKVLVR